MKITNDNKTIEFAPVSYQFPELTKDCKHYDEWNSNWLNIRFFCSDGQSIRHTETDACVLTYEMTDFIDGLKKLSRGLSDDARLDTLEPYLKIDVVKSQSGYEVTVGFYRFIEAKKDLDLFEVKTVFGEEELSLFISGLEEEFKPFPKR